MSRSRNYYKREEELFFLDISFYQSCDFYQVDSLSTRCLLAAWNIYTRQTDFDLVNLMERLQEDFCLLTERKQSPATEGACIVGSLRRKLRQLRGPRWHRHCDVIRAATCTHPGSKGDVELLRRARVKNQPIILIIIPYFFFLFKKMFVHLSSFCIVSFFYSSMSVSKRRDFDNLINQ